MSMKPAVLAVMAKKPQVGVTKTRLCPPLSPERAAALYEALLQDTISLGATLERIELAIAVTPPSSRRYFEGITPSGTLLLPIECRDIGDCLTQVFSRLLGLGYHQILALNADGPSLPPEYILQAVDALDKHDLVLGPSEDGGYYLIGMQRLYPEVFSGISWSTSLVMSQTLEKANALDLSVKLLPRWYDVDTGEDLERLRAELKTFPSHRLKHTRSFFLK